MGAAIAVPLLKCYLPAYYDEISWLQYFLSNRNEIYMHIRKIRVYS